MSAQLNEAIFQALSEPAVPTAAQVINAVNDFVRTKMREDGFYRRLFPLGQRRLRFRRLRPPAEKPGA